MKAKIHPNFYSEAKVICSCGNSFTTGSTKQLINVEVCHRCHPLYTGEQRYIDTRGKVEEFQRKQKIAAQYRQTLPSRKKKSAVKEEKTIKTLKELLTNS